MAPWSAGFFLAGHSGLIRTWHARRSTTADALRASGGARFLPYCSNFALCYNARLLRKHLT